MRLMLTAGAIVTGAKDFHINAMAAFGESLGKAYQILDDIVDESEDSSKAAFPGRYVDVPVLWERAEKRLKESRSVFMKALADQKSVLLLAFADSVFDKLRKQATGSCKIKKWDCETFSQKAPSLQIK